MVIVAESMQFEGIAGNIPQRIDFRSQLHQLLIPSSQDIDQLQPIALHFLQCILQDLHPSPRATLLDRSLFLILLQVDVFIAPIPSTLFLCVDLAHSLRLSLHERGYCLFHSLDFLILPR